jgi:hypothetical protein
MSSVAWRLASMSVAAGCQVGRWVLEGYSAADQQANGLFGPTIQSPAILAGRVQPAEQSLLGRVQVLATRAQAAAVRVLSGLLGVLFRVLALIGAISVLSSLASGVIATTLFAIKLGLAIALVGWLCSRFMGQVGQPDPIVDVNSV